MFKQLLEMLLKGLEEHSEKDSSINEKVLELADEIMKLEIEYAEEYTNAERWGDLNDPTDFRTANVNRIKRVIEAKQKMIETLQIKR